MFPASLAVGQRCVARPLRICAHQRIAGTIYGFIAVAGAGAAATYTFATIAEAKIDLVGRTPGGWAQDTESIDCTSRSAGQPWWQEAFVAGAFAVVGFKMLGGRLRSVSPSHIWHPGAFARQSVPAAGAAYATPSQKSKVVEIGKRFGCHHCGTRRGVGSWVADHMPPNARVARWRQSQAFYPQCSSCSSSQGGSVSSGTPIRICHTSLRLYHLWLPLFFLGELLGLSSFVQL